MAGSFNPVAYRKDIDGLRAVAVLSVVFYHAGVPFFAGGFLGVDVFFVISGFLITSILMSDFEGGELNLRHFYERRARRLLPALVAVTLSCIPFSFLWLTPSQVKDFGQSLVAVSIFVSNFLFVSEAGYFAAASETKPLLHTWSLAVEEQWYLLFPLFFWFILRRTNAGPAAIFFVVAIVSFCQCLCCVCVFAA